MLNEFITKVKSTGLAKTNRYKVSIATPTKMLSFLNTGRLITLFCESTSLPGMIIATTEQRIMGEPRELPYARVFDTITMSFYIDNSFEVKGFFDNWMNCISNGQNKITSYYKDYIAPTVTIEILPMNSESSVYYMTLYEVYPKAVSPVQLANDSREIAKIGVNFTYKYYTTSLIDPIANSNSFTNPNANTEDLQSFITASGFQENMLEVKNQTNNELINSLSGR